MLEAFARHGLFDLAGHGQAATSRSTPTTPSRTSASAWARPSSEALGDKAASRASARPPSPWTRRWSRPPSTSAAGPRWSTGPTRSRGSWIGTFDAELAREFFGGFASTALCNLHLEVRYGENAHHMVEAMFKAFARAASAAVRPDPRVVGVPSTKGTLTG